MALYEMRLEVGGLHESALQTIGRLGELEEPIFPMWSEEKCFLLCEGFGTDARQAAHKLVATLDKFPIKPLRFDLELMSIREIANELNVDPETVRLWASGKRRSGFPAYFTQVGSSKTWAWSDVQQWAVSQNIDVSHRMTPLPIDVIVELNGILVSRNDMRSVEIQEIQRYVKQLSEQVERAASEKFLNFDLPLSQYDSLFFSMPSKANLRRLSNKKDSSAKR